MRKKGYKWKAAVLALSLAFALSGCSDNNEADQIVADMYPEKTESTSEEATTGEAKDKTTESAKLTPDRECRYAGMEPEEILAQLTLEQKAAQMVQPACYQIDDSMMLDACYGSVLSQGPHLTDYQWRPYVDSFQDMALDSEAGVPYIYGQDDVHGVNYCINAVYFPQNIGMGAANDPELMYEIGKITADEAKLCHMLLNFSPCVAQSVDPRWGRTYESFGADLDIITELGTSYAKGLLDGGMVVCAKHYFADGNVKFGTGEVSDVARLIDRGDAQLSDKEIEELLTVYQELIDTGVQVIMISHSSLNGVKMHENKEYIMKLKDEMGFGGFILSDWNSIQNTSPSSYYDQVVTAVNAGIDMLMEPDTFDSAREIITEAVQNGEISEERIDDAVLRILKVKKALGLFEDPYYHNIQTVQLGVGSDEYRKVAEKAVEESLVLLKNENDLLPLKPGTSVYITGPAADHAQAQCGGWTVGWNSSPEKDISGVTTIEKGFLDKAEEYGITVYTDTADADKADVVILCVGEEAYAEWNGDTEDLELCGALGLSGNKNAISEAASLGKPVITLIVAGRQVILGDDYNDWDAAVMCYLPGSEGQGIANVLCGAADFTGKLPSPWYSSTDQIESGDCWLEQGYGLTYGD